MSDVTIILSEIENGDRAALDRLLPAVYDELRSMAAARMAAERPDHTLQATALVHDAWIQLAGDASRKFNSRRHFMAAAAEAMRCILVDYARARLTGKRGGGMMRTELVDDEIGGDASADQQTLEVSDALDALAQLDPASAELVKLRYFAGLTLEEAAEIQGSTLYAAEQNWLFAKSWLLKQLQS